MTLSKKVTNYVKEHKYEIVGVSAMIMMCVISYMMGKNCSESKMINDIEACADNTLPLFVFKKDKVRAFGLVELKSLEP